MSAYTLSAAIIGYLLLVVGTLSLLVHLDVLGRGTAFRIGLVAIAPILAVPLVLDVLGRSESDTADVSEKPPDVKPTTTDDQLTEPEPSYEDDHDDDHPPADSDADTVWLDAERRAGDAQTGRE